MGKGSRKTIGMRMAAKRKQIRQQLRQRLHARTRDIGSGCNRWFGYFQYYAVPRNEGRLPAFRHEVLRMWWRQLRRRRRGTRWSRQQFEAIPGSLLPEVEILHPCPEVYFASQHIRSKNRVRQERQHGSVRGLRATGIPTATRSPEGISTLLRRHSYRRSGH